MKFYVYSKAQGAGWSRDWYWAPRDGESKNEHGPYPLRLWAWLAATLAWVKGRA